MAYNESRDRLGAHTLEYYQQYNSTIENGEARIPICICVDTSHSMKFIINQAEDFEYKRDSHGNIVTMNKDGVEVNIVVMKPGRHEIRRIDELRRVLSQMITRMHNDELLSRAAVMSIITFDKFAYCFREFSDVSKLSPNDPERIALGQDQTNMGQGLRMALDRLDQQVALGNDAGNDTYCPVLVFMSDGSPTDETEAERLREEVKRRSAKQTLKVIPIGIGINSHNDPRWRWLAEMTDSGRVYTMNTPEEFVDVFDEISDRLHRSSLMIAVDDYNNLDNPKEDKPDDNTPAAPDSSSTDYGLSADMKTILDLFNYGDEED